MATGQLERLSMEEVVELGAADQAHRRQCKALGVGEKKGPPAIRADGKLRDPRGEPSPARHFMSFLHVLAPSWAPLASRGSVSQPRS